MANQDSHLTDVLNAPEGPHIAALFDFDGTIIAGYSATAMLWEKIKRREMTAEEIVETLNVTTQYRRGGEAGRGDWPQGVRRTGIEGRSASLFAAPHHQRSIDREDAV